MTERARSLRALAALTALALLLPLPAAGQERTPWGDPDLQGMWVNNIVTPLERPAGLGERLELTDEELAELQARAAELRESEQAGNLLGDLLIQQVLDDPDFQEFDAGTGNYNSFWLAERKLDNRTSLIVDPPDGRLPALTDEGEKRAAGFRAARNQPAAGPEDRSLTERCISFGVPRLRAAYNSYTQIFQGEDHVVLLMEMIHDARVVPIDDRPHLPEDVRLWHGDSRGHWEGETLVIETRNFSDTGGYRGATGNLQLVERLTRVGPETLEYVVTLDDPKTWTEPWTVMIPLRKSPDDLFEFACHEGNYGLEGILAGARAEEAALAASR
jgi:hypothetical protein